VALILEVLDARTGEVRVRRWLEGGPLTLGRGYDNDIVIDDPYVDAHHARIGLDEGGAFVIEDLGSLNALVGPDGTRQTQVPARAGTVLRVGRTTLRFQDSDAPLPSALRDAGGRVGWFRVPGWLGTTWGQLTVTGTATGVFAWNTWLGTYEKSGASESVSTALGLLMLVTVWAGVWAVAGRVVVQRFRFLAHVAVTSSAAVAALIYATGSDWAAFVFPDNALGRPVAIVLGIALVTTLVAVQLGLASVMTRRRRWVAGLVTSGVLLAIAGVVRLAEERSFSDVAEFSGTLKPYPAALLPTGRVERLGADEVDLKRRVDALVATHE